MKMIGMTPMAGAEHAAEDVASFGEALGEKSQEAAVKRRGRVRRRIPMPRDAHLERAAEVLR
jgi:hypothetical protein